MTKKYWVITDSGRYTFDQAFAIVSNKENYDAGMRIRKPGSYFYTVLTYEDLPDNMDDAEFPLWMTRSNQWEIVRPDYEKESKAEEIKDWLEYHVPGFELDTRFFDRDKMGINDWWNRLDEQILIHRDDVVYDIMMWLKETGRLEENYGKA